MDDNVIGTSSYSEAMDLSDIDESGYEQEMATSPEHRLQEQKQEQKEQHEQASTQAQDTPPVKVRKKPGRKPNPASPALRKAQNRAAQRAFRERKERHMKDLESNIRGIKDHRDRLLQENEKMSSENEILKAENWYLKGIVLSLQLVCLQHNLVIPQHCPHVDDQTLGVLNQSIPESIASYINVNSRNKLQISNKLVNDSADYQNVQQQQQQKQPYNVSQPLPSGSLIITQDGVHSVPEKQRSNTSWYHQTTPKMSTTSSVSSNNDHPSQAQSPFNTAQQQHHPSPSSADDNSSGIYHNIPPLSPMSTATSTTATEIKESEQQNDPTTASLPKPVLLSNEPVSSNLAAIQTLRLRLRLQSACVRMQSIPFAIQPTLLQLTIPHDPRIDLIPTPHMRDRMILYREQFDLDDCFRCLLSGSVFHGGDPAVAGNWQLPAEFFEKYWFLTIDYNLRRTTNEWRKLQGLKEIKPNIISKEDAPMTTSSTSPPQPSTLLSQQLHPSPIPPLYHQQHHVNKESAAAAAAAPLPTSGLSYADLSGYLGVQLSGMNNKNNAQHQQQQQEQQSNETSITPIQLTNGYGIMNAPSSTTTTSASGLTAGHGTERKSTSANQTSPWEHLLMGQKSYDMMMTGLYNSNSNDMDQQPH